MTTKMKLSDAKKVSRTDCDFCVKTLKRANSLKRDVRVDSNFHVTRLASA